MQKLWNGNYRKSQQQSAVDILAIKTFTKWLVNCSHNRNNSIYKKLIDIEIIHLLVHYQQKFIQKSNTVQFYS